MSSASLTRALIYLKHIVVGRKVEVLSIFYQRRLYGVANRLLIGAQLCFSRVCVEGEGGRHSH